MNINLLKKTIENDLKEQEILLSNFSQSKLKAVYLPKFTCVYIKMMTVMLKQKLCT